MRTRRGTRIPRAARISLVVVAALLLPLADTSVASASIDELGPTPQICNAYALTPLCFYAAVSGTDTFNIGKHILYPGDEVTGTYRWSIGGQGAGEYASFGAVTVAARGPGLKLLRCHGPRRADNNDATWRTPRAFDVTKGHTTCTWKAVSDTGGWVSSIGLRVLAGGGTYLAGDFYAVISKGGTIEGHVREQNVAKKIENLTGIAGAKVRVTGPKGYVKTVTSSDSGYYHVTVPRVGTYTVKPTAPDSYFKGGKRGAADPESRKVRVKEQETTKADFTYKSTLRLRLTVDKSSVPSDGQSFVNVTVTASDAGKPVANQAFSLRPFGGGSALESPWGLKVPATICSVYGGSTGARVWPDPNPTSPNTSSVDLTTDSTGQATLRVYTGTVPGAFPLSVWAKDSAGKLITRNVTDVSDDVDIQVSALAGGGDPATALHDWLTRPGNETVAGALPTRIDILTNTLIQAMGSGTGGSGLGAFVVTPVQTPKPYYGLLLTPEGSRVTVDVATGAIDPASPGWLIAPGEMVGAKLAAGGYWGLLKTTNPPAALPTLAQWLADGAPGYAFPGNTAPVTLYNSTRLQYGGFGYGPACL